MSLHSTASAPYLLLLSLSHSTIDAETTKSVKKKTRRLSKMKKLPPEIICQILNDLTPSSLKAIRICWRFLEPFILPRLFHTIKINFAEKQIKRLQGIALSPNLAPLVQQLIWTTSGTRDTHDDPHGHVNTWAGHEDYIKETWPQDLDPERDEIDGLVYALWPAMCRSQSRITSFRCQDPLNYMRWLNYECLQAMGGLHTELPASFPASPLRATVGLLFRKELSLSNPIPRRDFVIRLIMAQLPMIGPHPASTVAWKRPLRSLGGLDLRIDSAGGHWRGPPSSEGMLKYFLTEASNIRELSLRFRPTGTYPRPTSHSKWVLQAVLCCGWEFLQTIKISFAMLPTSQPLFKFMEGHAKTLKHILLHQCSANEDIIEIIRGAAKVKDIKLHRFLVFPSCEGRLEVDEPRIIPERLVLDFINNKDPSLDPFDEWMPGKSCNWGTIAQKAASVSEEWPKDDGMHFTCRQCTDQVQEAASKQRFVDGECYDGESGVYRSLNKS
ncbi:uncharacterized protein NECHADRAFT_77545 [Fusarium vanettenii 77-13-4]|uniref:F-box domain-containing protein n=1 Tax=Fusarium vanettenii (strain ATCC MYA-4622 / CBS 123669 / FGSC 9596 / NRRL 45880 / 77-13-4) TaxID=660122 RepID=C7YLI4_FUSV7|nr:uncharacterized protein NECHADRAFT_77545 [Fusarium vanettenii 77-13-4]EEU46789.1 hypothetical protein NECHADRAFT_77545 [Fusarium vanettenii 77-13-4]